MPGTRLLAAAAVTAALSGCWVDACVEPVTARVDRCWDEYAGLWDDQGAPPSLPDGQPREPWPGNDGCGGDWHHFESCSSLGFTEPCSSLDRYWARPGEEQVVCE